MSIIQKLAHYLFICTLFTLETKPTINAESIATVKLKCQLQALTGSCRGHIKRYFYDINTNNCSPFVWGGCDSNGNNFASTQQCMKECTGAEWILIDSHTEECVYIVSTIQCLRVKWSKQQQEWEPLTEMEIDGFNYVPGYRYELLLTKKANPDYPSAPDAEQFFYSLYRVLSKTKTY